MGEGRHAEAIIELRNAVSLDDRWGEARFQLAEAFAANGEPEKAYREYLRAADLLPDNTAVQIKAVSYLVAVGQFEDSRTRVERVVNRDPTNVDGHLLLAESLAGLKQLDAAAAQIEEALRLDATRSACHLALARIRVAQNRPDEARTAFARAIEVDQQSVSPRLALASFFWSNGEAEATGRTLKDALSMDAKNVATNRALGSFYLANGQPAEAEPHLRFVAEATGSADAQLALADYYATYERPADARKILEPLSRKTTVAAAAQTRLAEIEYAGGRRAPAHQALDAVLAREPNNPLSQVVKARWLIEEGKFDEALSRAQIAISASPRMASAYYIRGVAEARTRRTREAIASFSEVLRIDPRSVDAQVQLSTLHLARHSVDSAALFAEEALKNVPNSLDARLALVRAWMAGGNLDRAASELATLRRQFPESSTVHELSGSFHALGGNASEARRSFERALALDASSTAVVIELGKLLLTDGRVADAKRLLEPRLEQAINPQVLILAGEVFLAAGDVARADATLRRVIQLDPLDIASFSLLARLHAQQKSLDTALREFDDIAKREPQNVAARIMAAVLVHTKGNLPDAKQRYEELLKLAPRAALVANNLASIYTEQEEQLHVAQQLAEAAAEQWPVHPEIQDTLGWIYYHRGLYGEAVSRLRSSVSAAPANAVYQYHLGLAYSKHGEPARAREALQTAVRLNPSLTVARQALAAIGG